MKLYSENKDYKLYNGSMLDMLEVIESNTIDSIVTDPPYELNFMGKGWDNSGIAFQPSTWKKCYEVLKPGGYLLAFGGSRTFHRIACAIEDAGFEIRDTIMWLYGSGFPKSMDISKQIDKKPYSKEREEIKKYIQDYINKSGKTRKQIDEECGFTACSYTRISYRKDDGWGSAIPNEEKWNIMKKVLGFDDKWDWYIKEAEREIIGTKKSGGANAWINGMNNKENEEQKYTGFSEWEITAPATDLAKKWQGWGTALKPSFEPIIIARKPFKGSLVDNVIEYGVGGINIDECRVEYEKTTNPATNPLYRQQNADKYKQVQGGELSNGAVSWTSGKNGVNEGGRFPANTILTYDETDFDEVCGGFPNNKSTLGPAYYKGNYTKNGWKNTSKQNTSEVIYNDSGSASRYYYTAKASKKDRDEGLDDFEEKENTITYGDGFNSSTKLATQEQIETGQVGNRSLRKNTHPTVKPTELMQYLVRLVTPNGGTILDPFNGSGSTGKAVMYENKERNKNYKYIGIELTEEYLPIAKARIEFVCNLTQEELKEQQMTIFDYIESKGE